MKLVLTILMLIGSTHLTANAQQIDDSLDLDPALTEEINAESGKIDLKKPQNGPSIKADAKQNRSIYIVNQSSSGAKADSKNKNELFDSETITNSRAEELKKSRKRAELETELKATEKIEESRLKDEQKRSDVLFSERFRALENNENTNINTNANTNQVPVQVIAPQQNMSPSAPTLSREDLKEELKSVLDEKEVLDNQKTKHKNNGSYFIGMVGLSEYPKADNIQGNGVFGFGLGVEVQDKLLVEGLFQYASYKSNFIWLKDIEEYSAIGAIKAQFSKSMIRPIAGGLIAYSYRTYTDTYANNQNPYAYQTNAQYSQSHVSAFDIGLLGGAQFVISDDFSIGGEFRYLWNLTSKTDGAYYPAFFPNSQPLDQMSHYSFLLTGRINF